VYADLGEGGGHGDPSVVVLLVKSILDGDQSRVVLLQLQVVLEKEEGSKGQSSHRESDHE